MKRNWLTKLLGGSLSVLLMLSLCFMGCSADGGSGSDDTPPNNEQTDDTFSSKSATYGVTDYTVTSATSSDISVATVEVSDEGITVTSKKAGNAIITAALKGGAEAKFTVTVDENGSIKASTIEVTKADGTTDKVDPTVQFTSQTKDIANNADTLGFVAVTATSSNENATVSIANGKITITSVSEGSATISVKDSENHQIEIPVTIDEAGQISVGTFSKFKPDVKVSKITVTGSGSLVLGADGNTGKLTAKVEPSNAANKAVDWASDDPSKVEVDASGNITGKAAADGVKITATAKDGSGVRGEFTVKVVDIANLSTPITIVKSEGWLESAYVTWQPVDVCDGYNVSVKKSGDSDWTKLDDQLVRAYSNTAGGTSIDYWRADALGLAAGNYEFKVVGTVNGVETASKGESSAVEVKAHDRSGFAFVESAGTSLKMTTDSNCPGAYKLDGTLKPNALVIYLTANTVDTVKATIKTDTNKTTDCVGITEILLALKKSKETRPIAFRVIGEVNNDGQMTALSKDFAGDFVIKGSGDTNRIKNGITLEGVGFDAVAKGWGARIANASGVEVRNLMFLECDSGELDNVGLQQNNDHIWVHNCTTTYGVHGSDGDQVKGDGAMDCKLSTYVTFSYNHFIDNGKCNLLGLKEGTTEGLYITYHHNWYDHSDSRHPRCRFYTAHVYNNYYDGNSKYGIGSTLGSSVFAEGNFYRSCKFPMLTSMQGSDVYAGATKRDAVNNPTFSKEAGGTIKAYNNHMEGKCTFIPYGATTYLLNGSNTSVGAIDTKVDFDAYVVQNRNDKVPETVVSYSGSNKHNNFDTDSGKMYAYTAQEPADAKATVLEYSGTYYGGDFTYDWSGQANPDTDHDEDMKLRALISAYKTKIVKIQGDVAGSSGDDGNNGGDDGNGEDGDDDGNGDDGGEPTPGNLDGVTVVTFTAANTSSHPTLVSGTFNINGKTTSAKIESSTSIKITAPAGSSVKLKADAAGKIKVNGTDQTLNASNEYTFTASGNDVLTKNTGFNLVSITITPAS